jgi:hypothetical protein
VLMAPSSMPLTLAPVVSILASGSTSFHTQRSSYSVLVCALSSLGYSYASRHDRRLTITTPSGSTLCHCTIQPNNTRVFPSSLVFPKTSVPTRKSVPSGAIELPFPALFHHRSVSHHRSVTTASSAIPADGCILG